jgi:hypothetical protein
MDAVDMTTCKAAGKLLYVEENGDGNIPQEFDEAVKAATSKAHDYHCRSAWFILSDQDIYQKELSK